MVRACINCCIPQLVPQIWIWGKNKYIQLFSTIYMTTLTYGRSDLTWRKWAAHLPTPAGQHRRWYRRYRRSSDPPTCRRTATWNHQKKQKNIKYDGSWNAELEISVAGGENLDLPICQANGGCLFETACHPGLCEWSWKRRWWPPSGAGGNTAVFGCQSNLISKVSNAFNITCLFEFYWIRWS